MNLPAKTAKAIAAGRATLILLPVRKGGGCPAKINRENPVQVGGRAAVCRVLALEAKGARLGDVTHADAKAMGWKNTQEFREHWLREHDRAWTDKTGDLLGVLAAADIEYRWALKWADQTAWAIRVELVNDKPRYLARPGPHQGDYVEQKARAIDDVEVIDAATQARFSKTAEGFCIGRQLARKKEAEEKRKATRAQRHPAPWWKRDEAA